MIYKRFKHTVLKLCGSSLRCVFIFYSIYSRKSSNPKFTRHDLQNCQIAVQLSLHIWICFTPEFLLCCCEVETFHTMIRIKDNDSFEVIFTNNRGRWCYNTKQESSIFVCKVLRNKRTFIDQID